MEKENRLYQGGQEKSFNEKFGWYTTAAGIIVIGVGLVGGSNSLAALGLLMTAGGLILGSEGRKSK